MVKTIVPALEDDPEPVLVLLHGSLTRPILVRRSQNRSQKAPGARGAGGRAVAVDWGVSPRKRRDSDPTTSPLARGPRRRPGGAPSAGAAARGAVRVAIPGPGADAPDSCHLARPAGSRDRL